MTSGGLASTELTVDRVVAKAAAAAFGRPLVTNVLRGLVAEVIVSEALAPGWRWCSADYASWDFEHQDGTRLEVKQSAAKQSWLSLSGKPTACSFDIKARQGRHEGTVWVAEPGRAAAIYVFAHHPVAADGADHRAPGQWVFYVIRTADLPTTNRISLATAKKLSSSWSWLQLGAAVDQARLRVCS